MNRIEEAEALLNKTIVRASAAKGGGTGAIVLTVSDLLALIRDYYDNGNPCGGLLHVLLDDGNVDEPTIDWCREHLDDRDGAPSYYRAKLILELLAELTVKERQLLYDRGYGRKPSDAFLAIEGAPEPEEVVGVTCPNGHALKVAASTRIPEEERLTFCTSCFASFPAPLVSDKNRWVAR